MKRHRNSQKRIKFQDACYFATVKTHNNHPYFRERIFCDLFVENLKLCKQLKGFLLYGWVLAYDHFHLLVQPNDNFDISKVMFSIKKQFSHDVNRVMGFNKPYHPSKAGKRLPAFGDGRLPAFGDGRLPAFGDGRLPDKIQQIINKHQNYVNQLFSEFQQKFNNQNPYPKFQWQESFHDHYIRNESDFDYHMEYIAYNPDKHSLPTDWPYVYTNSDFEELID